MAKNLLGKYVWLVETIYKAGYITFEEINQKWLDDDMDTKKIPLRTFHKWRIAAEDMFGLVIDCERKGGYHYFIGNASEVKSGSLRSWLLDTLSVGNLIMESQSIKDRILLEDVPSGNEYLSDILSAMKSNTVLRITYQSYWKNESHTFDIHPYCVKIFKQRWYLLAYSPYYEKIIIYSLDRILGLWQLDGKKFELPKDFNGEDFFREFYGVIIGSDAPMETVKLKVVAGQANYMRSLPLHHTQKEIESNGEYSIFTMRLRPEYDFLIEILSKGSDIEILEPVWFRDQMKERVKYLYQKYFKKQ